MSRLDCSRTAIAAGLGGGTVHALLALWLGEYVRSGTVWPDLVPGTLVSAGMLVVTFAGLVLLGGVPIVLHLEYELVVPMAALVVSFVGAFGTAFRAFETARATGATPIGHHADTLFGLLWVVPLLVILGLAVLEYWLRTASSRGAPN